MKWHYSNQSTKQLVWSGAQLEVGSSKLSRTFSFHVPFFKKKFLSENLENVLAAFLGHVLFVFF